MKNDFVEWAAKHIVKEMAKMDAKNESVEVPKLPDWIKKEMKRQIINAKS